MQAIRKLASPKNILLTAAIILLATGCAERDISEELENISVPESVPLEPPPEEDALEPPSDRSENDPATPISDRPAEDHTDRYAARSIELVNRERAIRSLPALTVDERLNKAAEFHARYMAEHDCFAHVCPGGPTIEQRMDDAGFVNSASAENVLAGAISPEEAVAAWMTSPEHRSNILNKDMTVVGAGYFFLPEDGGKKQFGHYWGMNFGIAVHGLPAPSVPGGAPDLAYVTDAVAEINVRRATAGLPGLRMDESLSRAASAHAEKIALTRCHDGGQCPDGTYVSKNVRETGYRFSSFRAQTVYGVMENDLLAERLSKRGNSAVLAPEFTDIGMGFYYAPEERMPPGQRLYWVVYVAKPAGDPDS